jgi:polysaccharide biosynthesis protein PelB
VHLRLDTDLRATASSAIVRETWFDYSPLRGTNSFVAVPIWVNERVRLAPFVSWTRQSSNDPATLTGVPESDSDIGISGLLRHPRHQTELTVSRRDALANLATARLAHTHTLAARTTTTATLGYNTRATDTTALLVGGVKDEARLAVFYGLAKREYLNGGIAFQKFRTQNRGALGDGRRYDLETGYRFRTEYPDLGLRLYAARQEYRHGGAADALSARLNPAGGVPPTSFFLPPSFNYYSASLGFGTALRGESFLSERLFETPYARGWRAFADVGYAYSSILRSGYNLVLGGGGSVFGNDYLAAYIVHSEGGTGTFTTVREIVVRYQLFF